MEMFDGSPHFFKVMVGDFAHRLCIPPAFAKKIRSEIGKGRDGVLLGPKGMQWAVKLCSTSTRIEFFGTGWEIFVSQHVIEFGDFLAFKYICGMYFRVRIYGKNGCEKEIPIFHSEKIPSEFESQRKCPDPSTNAIPTNPDHLMNRKPSVELKRKSTADGGNEVKKPRYFSRSRSSESPEHFHPSLTEKERQTGKSTKTKTEVTSKVGRTCNFSTRRPVNETEKKKALEAAESFESENPFGVVIMKPFNVYRYFRVKTPNTFIDKLKLPRERIMVTLVDPNRRKWPVRFLGDIPEASLISGWQYFSIANNLEEGDACIFERVDDSKNKIKLNVHIFRVVKQWSSYKYFSRGQVHNSLTSHLKEKLQVSYNDFVTNLPAKAFGPEKGKCVKHRMQQLQGENENPSNGSKCINLDKPRCKPSVSEREAGCRRSSRLAQICYLAKCPKKDLWDDKNVVILS